MEVDEEEDKPNHRLPEHTKKEMEKVRKYNTNEPQKQDTDKLTIYHTSHTSLKVPGNPQG
jgi:hypothetical protein